VLDDVKTEFFSWLKANRKRLVRGSTDEAVTALQTLGLDDTTLQAACNATRVVLSTPHASPNVFGQRMRIGWAAATLQRFSADTHHIRVVLTHTNMSDLGWRPYAWWTLSATGQLQVAKIFSRNKKKKHTALCALPPLELEPQSLRGADALAAQNARSGSDLSRSLMILMATIERAAGLSLPSRTTYIPLDFVLQFARDMGDRGIIFDRMLGHARGRRIDESGKLVHSDLKQSLVFDNATNLAALALFGEPVLLGGSKMLAYWPEVAAAGRLVSTDLRPVRPFLVPELDLASIFPLNTELRAALDEAGVEYSQGMAVSEYGPFAQGRQFFEPDFLSRLSMTLSS